MAVGKEVKTKINSVKSTQKITSAMEMVAASKMRRAQQRMSLGKPYAQRIRAVVGHLANAAPEYRHQYLTEREVKGFMWWLEYQPVQGPTQIHAGVERERC